MGVKRHSRGDNFATSAPDTTPHPIFSIEIKYRKKLPKFLMEGIEQARRYDPVKTPILVLKEKQMRGEIVVMSLKDFVDHLGKLDAC